MKRLLVVVPLALSMSGCAQWVQERGFPEVQAVAANRLGKTVIWNQSGAEDQAVRDRVRELLDGTLGIDAAVQVALLNNPSLQATYEDLGLAQADLVQAGLLRNPVFGASARVPDGPPSALNLEFGVAQDFLDLLMLPARKKLAEDRFEATRLRVSHAVLALAGEVRNGWLTLVAAQQTAAILQQIEEAARVRYELTQRIHAAGNTDDLTLADDQALYEQARVERVRAEVQVRRDREELNRLMGVWGEDVRWQAPDRLPELPAGEPESSALETLAVSQRLDLAAAGKQVETLARSLGVTRQWRYLTAAELGLSSERDTDRQTVTGSSLRFDLPIFDQGQARIGGGEAALRQAEDRLRALAVQVRSEVRDARDRMVAARQLIGHYHDTLVPLRERIVALTMQRYNYMLSGAADVLLARQNEIAAYRGYIDAYREYWTARSDLETAIGGRLPAATTAAADAPQSSGGGANHPGGHDHVESP